MSPSVAGPRFASVRVQVEDTTTVVPVAYEGQGGRTRLLLNSDAGSWVGQGRRFVFDERDDTRVTMFESGISLVRARFEHLDHIWHLNVAPPEGDVFSPGRTYTGTEQRPRGNSGWFDVYGDGRRCESTSTFTTEHVTPSGVGDLENFSVLFDLRCKHDGRGVRGLFEYRAPVGEQRPPPPVAGVRTDLEGDGSARTLALRWDRDSDAEMVVVRRHEGHRAPRTPMAGAAVASDGRTARVATLPGVKRRWGSSLWTRTATSDPASPWRWRPTATSSRPWARWGDPRAAHPPATTSTIRIRCACIS